jgi:hypothetical protein
MQVAKGSMTKLASILRTKANLDFYVGECPMFEKYWWWANQMVPLKKMKTKEKRILCSPRPPFFKAQKTKRNI